MIILWQAEEEEWQCVGHPITTVPKWNLALAAAERPYTPLILVGRELKLGQFRQIGWCKNSGGAAGAAAGGGAGAGGVQFY